MNIPHACVAAYQTAAHAAKMIAGDRRRVITKMRYTEQTAVKQANNTVYD